jgi:hypothetical protein
MRYSENEKKASKRKHRKRARFQKKKKSVITAAKKDISPKNAD